MPGALVIGGTRGIGAAIADELATDGWTVLRGARGGGDPQADSVVTPDIRVDVTEPASVADAANRWRGTGVPLGALVLTAGSAVTGGIAEVDAPALARMLHEHVVGPFDLVRALRPELRACSGTVLLVLSRMGSTGDRFGIGYGTAKAALAHLAESLAANLADDGVRVVAVRPAATATNLLSDSVPPAVLAGRVLLAPAEVARVAVNALLDERGGPAHAGTSQLRVVDVVRRSAEPDPAVKEADNR